MVASLHADRRSFLAGESTRQRLLPGWVITASLTGRPRCSGSSPRMQLLAGDAADHEIDQHRAYVIWIEAAQIPRG